MGKLLPVTVTAITVALARLCEQEWLDVLSDKLDLFMRCEHKRSSLLAIIEDSYVNINRLALENWGLFDQTTEPNLLSNPDGTVIGVEVIHNSVRIKYTTDVVGFLLRWLCLI